MAHSTLILCVRFGRSCVGIRCIKTRFNLKEGIRWEETEGEKRLEDEGEREEKQR